VASQDAGRVGRLEHHRTRAVTEQHAGGAVIEVEDARKHFRADHQRLAGGAGLDHGIGNGERVNEAAADSLYVEGGATGNTQFVLQDEGAGGKVIARVGGAAVDKADLSG